MKSFYPSTVQWSALSLAPMLQGGFADFDAIVDSFVKPTYTRTVNFVPVCDVREAKDYFLISFDVPGVKKEDVKIDVKGTELMISGERHQTLASDDTDPLRVERAYGKFERVFTLPVSVDTSKIKAHHDNGVLSVAIPKAETAHMRSVEIESGGQSFLGSLLGRKTEARDLKDSKKS